MQRWFDNTPHLVNKSSGYVVTASAKILVPRGNAQTRLTGSCPCRCTFGRQYVSIELQMACIHSVELAVYARLWVPNGNVWKGPTAHWKYCCTSIGQACLIELKGSLQRFKSYNIRQSLGVWRESVEGLHGPITKPSNNQTMSTCIYGTQRFHHNTWDGANRSSGFWRTVSRTDVDRGDSDGEGGVVVEERGDGRTDGRRIFDNRACLPYEATDETLMSASLPIVLYMYISCN